jgi:hypothetical protein
MEHRLFDPASPPEWLDPEWWRYRDHCDHLGSPTGAHVSRLKEAAALAVKAAGPFPALGEIVNPIIDLGAGDGALLELVGRQPHAWGYEINRADVKYAREVRGVNVRQCNVRKALEKGGGLHLGAPELQASVVVLTEVLEHMADPHGFLTLLHARPEVRYVVASSPHGETPEAHEWNHAWAWDVDGYEEMFEAAGFEPIEYHRVEWSQLWLFEAVRPDPDPEVRADAAEMAAAIQESGLLDVEQPDTAGAALVKALTRP